ncbi:MAG: phosphoenolpyruvate--protein phosphotransferase [Lachnospiraceae bacterium]|nr:phosphoenolpyruvate--protein phosphotransferase [Lachnospiraceae bacterium]
MMKGTAASDGIGIGKILLLEEASLEYTSHTVEDPAAEVERFRAAMETLIAQTERDAAALREAAGEKEALILEGHVSLLNDPALKGEAENLILAGQCAEDAYSSMCDMFVGIFSSMEDEMMRQRAADVRDIKDGLLRVLLGVKEVKIGDAPAGTVILTHELTPSVTAGIKKENIVGIITETGGKTSHSAILARALEIPAVLSVPDAVSALKNGQSVIVDGSTGLVIPDPSAEELAAYTNKREAFLREKAELQKFRGLKTVGADGTEYELVCNIGKAADANKVVDFDGEGVGLFRTEFLFMDRISAPTEEEQFAAYQQAALILKGKPVIVRTLDIGGDKEIPYMGLEKEENPFMGYRAIRYCLKNRELFRTQLRAILRASAFGDIRIMFPLITCVEELREGRAMVEEIKKELAVLGIPFNKDIPVGIMVETAAAAMLADVLAKEADFFSIGTNDLTGYTMSCDRGNANVAYLYSALQPAVLRMIERTIRCGREAGIPVGMCGEEAANEKLIPLLMSFGLTEFSVSAPNVLRVRRCISRWSKADADAVAEKAMSLTTAAEVEEYLTGVKR